MISQIQTAVHRSKETLMMDAIGAVSLVFMLFAALHLPVFT